MKKQNKNKERNSLWIAIASVLAIILIVAGSTYAYWTWQTADSQKTNVSVTVKGATLTIVGDNVTSATMRPTNDCDGAAALIGQATVTVVNETATEMRATPRLDVTLKPVSGRTFGNHTHTSSTKTDHVLQHLHWAVIDTSGSGTCSSPDYQGTFYKVAKTTLSTTTTAITPTTTTATVSANTLTTFDITNMNASYAVTNTLTFVASAATINQQGVTTAKTTTKTYKVFVWLDSDYEHVNTGTTVSDPMQDLQLTVKWSPNSTLVQE